MQQQYYPQVFSVESSSILFSTVFTIISVVNNQEEIIETCWVSNAMCQLKMS